MERERGRERERGGGGRRRRREGERPPCGWLVDTEPLPDECSLGGDDRPVP